MPVEQVPPFCETLWAAVVFSEQFAVLSETCEYCYAEGKSLSSTIDVRVLKVYGLCLELTNLNRVIVMKLVWSMTQLAD